MYFPDYELVFKIVTTVASVSLWWLRLVLYYRMFLHTFVIAIASCFLLIESYKHHKNETNIRREGAIIQGLPVWRNIFFNRTRTQPKNCAKKLEECNGDKSCENRRKLYNRLCKVDKKKFRKFLMKLLQWVSTKSQSSWRKFLEISMSKFFVKFFMKTI